MGKAAAAAPRLVSAAELAGVRPVAPLDDEPPELLSGPDPLVAVRDIDPCDWIGDNFYILNQRTMATERIKLRLLQKAIIRYCFTRNEAGRFPFQMVVISTIKKSGKTTLTACLERWLAETQVRYGEIYCLGNDRDQARDRSFKFVKESIEMTPGYDRGRKRLAGRWNVFENSLRCLTTGTVIKAIAVDASGEAGGRPYCSIWTELWGFENKEARKLWTEMTPVPTIPDSMRLVDSYAGFEGESELLRSIYDRGMGDGRQLTNHELASAAARDVDGERYEDFLHAFTETNGDPDALVPCWVEGRMFMYWDSGTVARRVPEDQTPEYYAEQEKELPPQEFNRIHGNVWGASVSNAIPMHEWDACFDPDLPPLLPGDRIPIVLSCDAGTSGDCFAITAISRHPADNARPALRELRMWQPSDFADEIQDTGSDKPRILYKEPEAFLRWCFANFNVLNIAYDPYQLEDMMQRLRGELGVYALQFLQGKDRDIADRAFYDHVIQRELAWNFHDGFTPGEPPADGSHSALMRQHILNANKKVQKDQESKLRFIKKHENKPIDLLISASQGVRRAMWLMM